MSPLILVLITKKNSVTLSIQFDEIFFFLMLFFAALQWNDIDAPIWISIYLVTALLALITYKQICLTCSVAWALVTTLLASYMLIGVAPGIINFLESNTYTEIFSP